ncbi:MAG: hypothetical protein SOW46_01665 [Candidatus Aphodomonas sp.]|nr:hypothetical protein [Candidatus Aphodomonas sp.]
MFEFNQVDTFLSAVPTNIHTGCIVAFIRIKHKRHAEETGRKCGIKSRGALRRKNIPAAFSKKKKAAEAASL